jgi:phosphoenolpyruvate carboxykinase (ATP)
MMWHPNKYAELLAEKIKEHKATAWLVNTGWTGGAHGVGSRMSLKYTRAMIDAIHHNDFDNVEFVKDEEFGFQIPLSCPNVPSEILIPKNTWEDKEQYQEVKKKLVELFNENFKKFAANVNAKIVEAGPSVDHALQS